MKQVGIIVTDGVQNISIVPGTLLNRTSFKGTEEEGVQTVEVVSIVGGSLIVRNIFGTEFTTTPESIVRVGGNRNVWDLFRSLHDKFK